MDPAHQRRGPGEGTSYSRLIAGLRQAEVEVDRKVLADLAVTDPGAFSSLVELSRAALADGSPTPVGAGDAS